MSKANVKSSPAPKTTAKSGQASKTPAPVVRPAIPNGKVGIEQPLTAVKAGAKPSEYYPQGDAVITLLPKGDRMGSNQQANWDAIHAALGGKLSGSLPSALADSNPTPCTRRHVRRLGRAGYLVWSA